VSLTDYSGGQDRRSCYCKCCTAVKQE
jgi:hypothetical protein